MHQYLNVLAKTLHEGRREENRTGTDTYVIKPVLMEFDLAEGFPAVTTKKLAFNQCKGEFIGFMQAKTSAAAFRDLGCTFWDANANDPGTDAAPNKWLTNGHRIGPDDLGLIYGYQWRKWECGEGVYIDQVIEALDAIRQNPTSRRIIINAWRPDHFAMMALPPCHVAYQFMVDVRRRELSLSLWQRSGDLLLGVPMNIASCGLMLSFFAALTGLRPRHISHYISIPHLYVNHVEQANAQLDREPLALPRLGMNIPKLGMASDAEIIASLTPASFWLEAYESHGALPAPMAV